MSDPQGKLIPRGVMEELTVEIQDEIAVFYFKDPRNTERIAKLEISLQKEKGQIDTIYSERMKKAVTKYEGKTKEEIKLIILEQFKKLSLNIKK